MKKLLIAASFAMLAVGTGPAFVGQAQAAPAKNPMCALAGSQKDLVGWSQFYGCFGSRPTMQRAMVRSRPGAPQSDFCKMTAGEKDMVGWSQFYGCWHH
jgi:hypothetical protein